MINYNPKVGHHLWMFPSFNTNYKFIFAHFQIANGPVGEIEMILIIHVIVKIFWLQKCAMLRSTKFNLNLVDRSTLIIQVILFVKLSFFILSSTSQKYDMRFFLDSMCWLHVEYTELFCFWVGAQILAPECKKNCPFSL